MITQPSSSRLLSVVREELRTTIAPAVGNDAVYGGALAMIDEVLRIVANRCEHEIAWMLEEIDSIAHLAQELVAAGHDCDGILAAGLARLQATERIYDTPQLCAQYSDASELLSLCLERAMTVGGDAKTAANRTMLLRSEHETALRGADSTLVARG